MNKTKAVNEAICPFFHGAGEKTISCVGLISGDCRNYFDSEKVLNQHFYECCASDYYSCPIALSHIDSLEELPQDKNWDAFIKQFMKGLEK